MLISVRKLLEWEVNGRPFSLLATDVGAELTSPDGQCLAMSTMEWQALNHALQTAFTSAKQAKNTVAASQAPNHGRPWDAALDSELLKGWHSGGTLGDLAEQMGRSRGSIAARLVIVGGVQDRDEANLESRRRQLLREAHLSERPVDVGAQSAGQA